MNIKMVRWNFISTSSSTEGTIQSGCAEGAPLNEALRYIGHLFNILGDQIAFDTHQNLILPEIIKAIV